MPSRRVDLKQVAQVARERFALGRHSVHGAAHWKRVREIGLRLANKTGADPDLVRLFALLHDCCRESDGADLQHGPRAAAFIETLRGTVLVLEDERFSLLRTAIHDHTSGHHHSDPTVGTCWDADRLDIGRVGRKPLRRFMSTDAAKEEPIMRWAYRRSRGQIT